jgi:ATP-binding cassette subfamily B (MDR/TAP) protein 1
MASRDIEEGNSGNAVAAVEAVPTATPEKKDPDRAATLAETFSQADWLDYILMFFGVCGGLVTGFSIPFFNILFGRMLDNLNGNPNSFSQTIDTLCISFTVVAAANLLSGWMQVAFWTRTGERQTQKFRENYVKAILSQEIGWFDINGANELSTKVAELTGKIQDGIGKKMGDLTQYVSQVIFAFIIAFYYNWKLTLVLLSTLPLIAGAGAFMINAITNATQQSLSQYASAGGLATESLGAIRTVTALNAQPDVITRYRRYLFDAMKVGILKGLNVGLGNGLLFGVCFLTYSLGFYYGGYQVAGVVANGCSGNDCMTGGKVMSVFFCVIMGSMGLGQVAPPLSSFTQARTAIYPIMEVIRRKPLIDGLSEAGDRPTTAVKGDIEFKDVHFAYPSRPANMVCKGYNLSLRSGQSTALVGVSGSGKVSVLCIYVQYFLNLYFICSQL